MSPARPEPDQYDTCALVSTALELLQRAGDVDHESRR
jgi:hypothetical protein